MLMLGGVWCLGLKRGESRWKNREGSFSDGGWCVMLMLGGVERRELKYKDSGERNFGGKKG